MKGSEKLEARDVSEELSLFPPTDTCQLAVRYTQAREKVTFYFRIDRKTSDAQIARPFLRKPSCA
jgi:hypothetical protein